MITVICRAPNVILYHYLLLTYHCYWPSTEMRMFHTLLHAIPIIINIFYKSVKILYWKCLIFINCTLKIFYFTKVSNHISKKYYSSWSQGTNKILNNRINLFQFRTLLFCVCGFFPQRRQIYMVFHTPRNFEWVGSIKLHLKSNLYMETLDFSVH